VKLQELYDTVSDIVALDRAIHDGPKQVLLTKRLAEASDRRWLKKLEERLRPGT